MICLYLYQYLSLWDVSYIIENGLMSTSQCKFNCANLFSCSWDISRQSFYSYWCPDISVICCCFYTSHICADSPHLGLSSITWFVKISPLVVEIQAEWSLWHFNLDTLSNSLQFPPLHEVTLFLLSIGHVCFHSPSNAPSIASSSHISYTS